MLFQQVFQKFQRVLVTCNNLEVYQAISAYYGTHNTGENFHYSKATSGNLPKFPLYSE